MTRAEHYRKRAKQAEQRAKEWQDPQAKREYLDIATKIGNWLPRRSGWIGISKVAN